MKCLKSLLHLSRFKNELNSQLLFEVNRINPLKIDFCILLVFLFSMSYSQSNFTHFFAKFINEFILDDLNCKLKGKTQMSRKYTLNIAWSI